MGAAIIKSAPRDDATHAGLFRCTAVNLRMCDGLRLLGQQISRTAILAAKSPLWRSIGELPDTFSKKIWDARKGIAHTNAAVRRSMIIIVSVDILKPIFCRIAIHRTGGRPGIVKGFGCLLGPCVKLRPVCGLVDAHAPDDDGGTVSVAADHVLDITHGEIFPGW